MYICPMKSSSIVNFYKGLCLTERLFLRTLLQQDTTLDLEQLKKVLQERKNTAPCCVSCQSSSVSKYGKVNGVQRFVCKECRHQFLASHGTALYRIQRKDKWNEYIKLMDQGVSIKRSAKILGIAIQTSFNWRHKIMASMRLGLPTNIGGIVECDELILPESQKGNKKLDRKPRKRSSDVQKYKAAKVNILTATSREEGTLTVVIDAKKLSGKQAAKALEGKLKKDTLLITDENRAYNQVARDNKEITHKTINSLANRQEKPKNGIHLQGVNNQHKQIRDFLRRFNGVATKNLPSYLNWYLYNQQNKDNLAKLQNLLMATFTATGITEFIVNLNKYHFLIRT